MNKSQQNTTLFREKIYDLNEVWYTFQPVTGPPSGQTNTKHANKGTNEMKEASLLHTSTQTEFTFYGSDVLEHLH
jgi:hypothetical protein